MTQSPSLVINTVTFQAPVRSVLYLVARVRRPIVAPVSVLLSVTKILTVTVIQMAASELIGMITRQTALVLPVLAIRPQAQASPVNQLFPLMIPDAILKIQ